MLAAAVPASANAAPAVPSVPAAASANLVQVSGGCGPAFYRDAWGYCVQNPYGYGYATPYRYYNPGPSISIGPYGFGFRAW